jgi:hypothetical protein
MIFDLLARDGASGTFAKVAVAAKACGKSMDGIGASAAGLAKLVLPTALIPTLAVAGAQAAGLATSLASAAGAGGIFGIAVVGQIAAMAKQKKAISALQTKLGGLTGGTKEYRQTLRELNSEQKDYYKQFGPAAKGLDALQVAWQKFLHGTSGSTDSVIGKATRLAASVLPKLVPVANAAGKAIGGLIDDLSKWTKGIGFQHLLDWLGSSGVQNITTFGHIIGNVFSGIGRLFGNFTVYGDKVAGSLEKITGAFAKWAGSKSAADGIQRFLAYANQNGPAVSTVLASLAQLLPKIVGAFSGMGSITLTGISDFLKLLASLPAPAVHAIADGILACAIATKAWAVATKLWAGAEAAANVVMAISNTLRGISLAELPVLIGLYLEAAKGTKAWAVMQGILNAVMDANPIGIVVVAIAALVAGVIIAYKKVGWFRAGVQAAFKAIAAAGKWMWNNVLQPVFHAYVSTLGHVALAVGKFLIGIGHIVPGASAAGRAMVAAGQKALDFADKLRKIPNNTTANVHVNGVSAAIAATARYRQMLANLNNSVATTYIRQITTKGPVAGGGHPVYVHNAGGTPYFPGGMTWVGEHGPEQVYIPRGSRIVPNEASHGGSDVLGVVEVVVKTDDGREIQRKLLTVKRQHGGKELGLA